MNRYFLNRLLLGIFSLLMLLCSPTQAQERFTELVSQFPFSISFPQQTANYQSWVHVAVLHPQAPVLRSGYLLGIKRGDLHNASASNGNLQYLGAKGQLHDVIFDVFDAEGKLLFSDAEDCILTGAAFFDVPLDSQYAYNLLYHAEVFESLSLSPDSVLSGNERSLTLYDAPICLIKQGKSYLWDPIQKSISPVSYRPEKRMNARCWKAYNGKTYACLEMGNKQSKAEGLLELGDEILNETFVAKTEKGWGLMNLKSKWIIPPRFNELFFANDSMLIALSGGTWKAEEHVRTVTQETSMRGSVYTHEERYVDTVLQGQKAGLFGIDGKKIVPVEYDYILVLNHLILACNSGAYVSEANNNLPVIDPRYERYGLWLAQHWYGNPVCDVYSKKGKLQYKKSLLTGFYSEKNPQNDKTEYRLALYIKGKEGLINEYGKTLVPFAFSAIHFYSGMHKGNWVELIIARKADQGIELYSGSGKLLSDKTFSSAMPVVRPMSDHELAEEDLFLMVMGIGGNGEEPSDASSFPEEENSGNDSHEKFVLMDPNGVLLSKEPLDGLEYDAYYGEFNARIGNKTGRLGLNGIWLVPPMFGSVRPVNKGVYVTTQGDFMGLYANGFELVPEYEQMYWVGSAIFIVVRQGAFGMFDLKSKSFLLEPEFDFIYKLNEQYLLCGKEQKKGIVDYSGNLIIPIEFNGLDLAPPGFSPDIVRVESNGKIGYFSLSQKKMITAPVLDFVSPVVESGKFFRCLQGGEMEVNAVGELIALRNARYGIVDSSGKIIVPPVYSDVSPFSEDGEMFRAVGAQGEVFFRADGSIMDHQQGLLHWRQTLLFELGKNSKKTNWISTPKNGIHVLHPSAFFTSKDGTYWVGTNGSGVWCSENRGESWSNCSQGLGNTSVLLLEEFQDTLFCLHHPLYEVSDYFTIAQTANLSYWNKTQRAWIPMERRELDVLGFEIFPFADTLVQRAVLRDSLQRANFPGQPHLISTFKNPYDFFGEVTSSYLPNPDAIQFNDVKGTDTLMRGIPKDIFPLFAGNLIAENEHLLMLSESGVYKMDHARNVAVLPVNGAETGKISKIVQVGKDMILALENNADLWKYNQGKWSKCFDHYAVLQKDTAIQFPLPVSCMVASINQSLIFCAAGNVYRMHQNDKLEVLVKSGFVADLFSEGFNFPNDRFVITHAVEDAQHELWCYGFFRNASGENEQERLGFFHWNKTLKKLEWKNDGLFFTFASPAVLLDHGKLFLENKLIDLFSHDTIALPSGEYAWDLASAEKLTFAPDGKIAVLLSPQLIAVYDPSRNIWQRIPNFVLKLKGIAFDSQGRLFAWTDYSYSAYETKAWQQEQKPSLFCLEMQQSGLVWTELNLPEIIRILSFTSFVNGSIWVGTDGAGVIEFR